MAKNKNNYGRMKESDPHKRSRLAYRNKLAKEANKRMRELEKTGLDYAAGNRKYREFIKETYGKKTKKKRFREYGAHDNYVTKEIHRLEKFLGYQTSTPEGVRLQKKRQKETTESRYGLNFENMEEYERFVEYLTDTEYGKMLGSAQLIDIIKSDEYTVDDLNKKLKEFRTKKPDNLDEIAKKLGFETAGDMEEYFRS